MFRELSEKETKDFQDWATNYFETENIIVWHPVVRRKLIELLRESLVANS